jgi:beta-glucosidase
VKSAIWIVGHFEFPNRSNACRLWINLTLRRNIGTVALPLSASQVTSIAIIGSHADTSVLSGGGSAQVDPPGGGASRFGGPPVWFPSSPLKAISKKVPKSKVQYNDGVDPA